MMDFLSAQYIVNSDHITESTVELERKKFWESFRENFLSFLQNVTKMQNLIFDIIRETIRVSTLAHIYF